MSKRVHEEGDGDSMDIEVAEVVEELAVESVENSNLNETIGDQTNNETAQEIKEISNEIVKTVPFLLSSCFMGLENLC